MSRTCPSCGSPLSDAARFCTACGARLDVPASSGAAGPAPRRRGRGIVVLIVCCVVVIVCAVAVGCLWHFRVGPFAPAEVVVARLEDIPDEAFRAYLAEHVDTNESGAISEEEVAATTSLGSPDAPDEAGNGLCDLGITDLTGIEHLTSLQSLACSGNALASLDLSANTQLADVACNDCGLTELTLPSSGALRAVHATGNPDLGTLDLSGCPSVSDVLLDEATQVVGTAPDEGFDAVPVEDLALVYLAADAFGQTDQTLGAVGPSAPGEDPDFDAALVFLMVYPHQFGDRPTLAPGSNSYGLTYESADVSTYLVPEATVRRIISSFYGSCPDDLGYLDGTLLEPAEGGWSLSAADGPFARTIQTDGWQAYGSYVTCSATVTYADGVADNVLATYDVTARRDEGSVFGYSLCERPVRTSSEVQEGTGLDPTGGSGGEPLDYYAYAVEQLDAAGLIPEDAVVMLDSETEDTLLIHVFADMGDHVATYGWYELDKSTLEITDTIFGTTI